MDWRKLGFYFRYICPISAASELKTEDFSLQSTAKRQHYNFIVSGSISIKQINWQWPTTYNDARRPSKVGN